MGRHCSTHHFSLAKGETGGGSVSAGDGKGMTGAVGLNDFPTKRGPARWGGRADRSEVKK